jgi:hypothetical protein
MILPCCLCIFPTNFFIFYAVRVVSKEIIRLVLSRTSCNIPYAIRSLTWVPFMMFKHKNLVLISCLLRVQYPAHHNFLVLNPSAILQEVCCVSTLRYVNSPVLIKLSSTNLCVCMCATLACASCFVKLIVWIRILCEITAQLMSCGLSCSFCWPCIRVWFVSTPKHSMAEHRPINILG